MKIHLICLWSISLLLFSCQQEPSIEELEAIINQLNQEMEKAYNNGELQKVANFYADDGWIIGPRGYKKQGRKEIDAYWTNISQPIRWKLDVIKVAKTEAELYQTDYWQKMKNKPPHWRNIPIEFTEADPVLYQLGHSTLEYEREDVTHHISQVDFIIVWKKQADVSYQIVVDTYEKN